MREEDVVQKPMDQEPVSPFPKKTSSEEGNIFLNKAVSEETSFLFQSVASSTALSFDFSHPPTNPSRWKSAYEVSKKPILIAILLSAIFHILILMVASRYHDYHSIKIEDLSHSIPVEMMPSSKFLETIDSLQKETKTPPKDPHFTSDRNLETKEETSPDRAPLSIPQQGGAKTPEKVQEKPRAKTEASKEKATENEKALPTDDSLPGHKKVQKKKFSLSKDDLAQEETESLKKSDGGLSSTGFNERLKRGEELKVNAAQSDYGQYITRMTRKLSQQWNPQRVVTTQMYNNTEVRVDLAVVLNNQGEIVELNVRQGSLFTAYDQEAIRAFREAGPFPNPPKSLLQDDGLIYMPWSFVLSMSHWGNFRVE